MRYAIVQENPDGQFIGFNQWKHITSGVFASREDIIELHEKDNFDVIHFLFDEESISLNIDLTEKLKRLSPDVIIILSFENKLSEKFDQNSVSFDLFDLILFCNDSYLKLFGKKLAGKIHRVLTSPTDISFLEASIVQSYQEKKYFTVIDESFSVLRLFLTFGFFANKILSEYTLRVIDANASDSSLQDCFQSSKYVYVPKPIFDKGKITILSALYGTILIAHPSVDGAKSMYPYTVFNPENSSGPKYMLKWLFQSKDYDDFIKESARINIIRESGGNKLNQLLNLINYSRISRSLNKIDVVRSFENELSIENEIKLIGGVAPFPISDDEFRVVCMLKDGEDHLPVFLSHYRNLGCKHFIFVDNYSDDNTMNLLLQQDDVTVYQTSLPHKLYENDIRRIMVEKHCKFNWCILLDIDELFDFPLSDQIGMRGLLQYLKSSGYNAMVANMLDMYSSEDLALENFDPENIKEIYTSYDISHIKRKPYFAQTNISYNRSNILGNKRISCYWGGVRSYIFPTLKQDTILTKHPLIYPDGSLFPVSNAHFSDNAKVADITGVLLHYKFIPSFKFKVAKSHSQGNYAKFTQDEYDSYHQVMEGNEIFKIHTPYTQRLRHIDELIDSGFLVISNAFKRFVKDYSAV
ncbi:MAG: glycosyltransferase family 2 protein [Sporocytophaga sp.]|uniref:glycosyltransferase family 2 protein n=1 Tax=Sporocytophaga sp. TaxID=2231183 RepID=UPI001B0F92EF|nr:glycosyltransferase family 2 protein [Sporocytophaga sp.]MBO9702732.1 glycosyltransferase family 2 protein [Sporocytophaga sp.]